MFLTYKFPIATSDLPARLMISVDSDNDDKLVIEEYVPSTTLPALSTCVYRRELTADQARELKVFLEAKGY